jgi:hypothetical protein
MTNFKASPALPTTFAAVTTNGCAMQGTSPSKLTNYANLPIVLVATEMGTLSHDALNCGTSAWQQAGAKASAVYLPDRGLKGGGHFAMAQLDNAAYAKVFIELATQIETAKK